MAAISQSISRRSLVAGAAAAGIAGALAATSALAMAAGALAIQLDQIQCYPYTSPDEEGFGVAATWIEAESASAPTNDLVWQVLTNGRVFWSLSLIILCPLICAFPKLMERAERVGDAACPLLAAALVAAFPLFAGAGPSGAVGAAAVIVVTGMCYGWMEVRLLAECARLGQFAMAFWAIAASQAIKMPLAALVGALPGPAQTAVTALVAASLFPTFALVRRSRRGLALNAAIEPARIALPAPDQTSVLVLLVLLVLLPVMNSVARALSNYAFWGGAHVVGASELLVSVLGPAVFLVIVAVTFARLRNEHVVGRLFVALVVILGCITLFDEDAMTRAGFPLLVSSTLVSATELYSHHLFWVIAVFAVRTVDWHPYRLAALTELAMSVVAFAFGLMLQTFTGMGRFLVNGALYAVVVIALALLWRMRGIAIEAPKPVDVRDACARLAAEAGLTPREAQVLELLAQGRSRVFMQEELGLSDSTIKAHTSHVYQKLGVHSKQELISLVRQGR